MHAAIGDVYAFQVHDGRWGACQVLSVDGDRIELCALDYLAAKPPVSKDAAKLQVLKKNWGSWNGAEARVVVDGRVPWWATRIAEGLKPPTFADRCQSYGFWQSAFAAYWADVWAKRGATADLTHTGPAGGLVKELIAKKVTKLKWDEPEDIDFSKTHLSDLHLTMGKKPIKMKVPASLHELTITGDASKLTLVGARAAFPFRLTIVNSKIVPPPVGLEAVQSVLYEQLQETDSKGLKAYTDLAELSLRGKAGKLTDGKGLAAIAPNLRELQIHEMFDLGTKDWPATWPVLAGVRISGLRTADAEIAKKAFKGIEQLKITGARTDAWLSANIDNPFRDWEEDSPALGRAACAAWKKAKTAKDQKPEEILQGLVTALNKLGAKTTIETIRREQAAEAFIALAGELGIAQEQAVKWFDAWRDF